MEVPGPDSHRESPRSNDARIVGEGRWISKEDGKENGNENGMSVNRVVENTALASIVRWRD
jgi:hypothetical protein